MSRVIEFDLPMDVVEEISIARQDQILSFFEKGNYTKSDLDSFVKQCRSFDLIRSQSLYENSKLHNNALHDIYDNIEVLDNEFVKLDNLSPDVQKEYITKGLRYIADGKLAVVVLCGGQGTRMYPGTIKCGIDIGLLSHKSLFHLYCDRICYVEKQVSVYFQKNIQIHFYVMTSEFNKKHIVSLFEENNYYGLQKSQVHFFVQGSFPCVDINGNCIMREPYKIAMSPNGTGGLFTAVRNCHVLEEWQELGIQSIHILSNANIALYPADPLFIGFALAHENDVCVECVEKFCPEEKLSMIAKFAGKPFVTVMSEMEYSQICKRDKDGELVFRYGFIYNTLMKVSFVKEDCNEALLPSYCHIVQKAIPYYDPVVKRKITPVTPNGYKMEYYLSDVFPYAKKFNVLVVPRRAYMPINNPPGKYVESPEVAVRELSALNQYYLELNHVIVDVTEDPRIEISPLVAYRDRGLARLKDCHIQTPCIIMDGSEVNVNEKKVGVVADGVVLYKEENSNCSYYVFIWCVC